MDRAKLAKYILLFLAVPFAAYWLVMCIDGYTTPMPTYKKTPHQLEEVFNDRMAQYGMSIDLDNGIVSEEDDYLKTTIPVDCADGSSVTCTFFTRPERSSKMTKYILFEQVLNGENGETVYLEPILRFILDEFLTAMTRSKDEPISTFSVSYNEALRICQTFLHSQDLETSIIVSTDENSGRTVTLTRKTGKEASLSVQLSLNEVYSYP